MSELNLERRETYRKRFSKEEKTTIFQHWTEIMNATKADMFFFVFINEFYPETKFDVEPCFKINKNMVKTITKHKWITEDKTIVLSNHPPLDNLIIKHFDSEVIAAPFKALTEDENTRRILEQNNFTNQHLHTIGKQLARFIDFNDSILPTNTYIP